MQLVTHGIDSSNQGRKEQAWPLLGSSYELGVEGRLHVHLFQIVLDPTAQSEVAYLPSSLALTHRAKPHLTDRSTTTQVHSALVVHIAWRALTEHRNTTFSSHFGIYATRGRPVEKKNFLGALCPFFAPKKQLLIFKKWGIEISYVLLLREIYFVARNEKSLAISVT